MPNLKGIQVTLQAPTEAKTATETETKIDSAVQLDSIALQAVINDFAAQRKQQDRILEFTLLNDKPFEIENNKVTFLVSNDIEAALLKEIKGLLSNYIYEKLQIRVLIENEVRHVEQKTVLYSPSDKFKLLSEQYPLLEELKRRLGLEIDF